MFATSVLRKALKKGPQVRYLPPSTADPEARCLVRMIFSKRRDELGLSSQEIYRDGLALMPGRPRVDERFESPSEVHPFRSVRYLKSTVLENMAKEQEIEKVFVRIVKRLPPSPPDSEETPVSASRPARPGLVEILASIRVSEVQIDKAGKKRTVNREEEQTCKVVLPPSGLSLDKFWIWRALPKLFAPNQVGGSA